MTVQDPDARILRALRGSLALPDLPDLDARIRDLRQAGYRIENETGVWRLAAAPPYLIAADLAASLPEDIVVGRQIVVFRETDSTNDLAAQAGDGGTPEGLVIFAEEQRAGRGRLGRTWSSPPGLALLFSILLRPKVSVERWPELTFCAALAVAEAAESITGCDARIKWPNDVQIDGRKVAGILLETHRSGFVVVGIGVNVSHSESDFPPELKGAASSFAMAAGKPADRRLAAAAILSGFDQIYARWPGDFSPIQRACQARGCIPPDASVPMGMMA